MVKRFMYGRPETKKVPCKHSKLDDLYVGLPVLIVDRWEDVTEQFLTNKYNEIRVKQYDIAPLYVDYWRNKIYKVRDDYQASHPKAGG